MRASLWRAVCATSMLLPSLGCTLQGLDEGLERQECETRADCVDLNITYPNADPCREWTCNRRTRFCQVQGRDRDDDQVVDIICPGGTDCNDMSAAAYPGATEVCDGLDNNCDARIDENLYQPVDSGKVADLTSATHGSPISVAYNPDDDELYAVVQHATESRAQLARWQSGQGSDLASLTVSTQGALGSDAIVGSGVAVADGRAQLVAAANTNAASPTCVALHTGPLSSATIRVSDARYGTGLAQASGARCPEANDGIYFPQLAAHDTSMVLWQSLNDRPFPRVRQCSDDLQSAVMLTTPALNSAQQITPHAVGFEPYATVDVGQGRALLAIAEDRGASDIGVFFYVLSGDASVPVVTPLGRGAHALSPRHVRLERGSPVGTDTTEIALTFQVGCFGDATIIVQRFRWQPSRTTLKPFGRPYQIHANDQPGSPSLYGASTVWNGSDWFVAWNEGAARTRLRRLTPVAESLLAADEQIVFEGANSGYGAPYTFLDSVGRPLVVAQSGENSPGLYQAALECIDP